MVANDVPLLLIGLVSGVITYRAYTSSGILTAAGVLLTTSWILAHLSSRIDVWNSLGTLLNPFHTGITFSLLGFTFAAVRGYGLEGSIAAGISTFFLGLMVSMLVYKYWNIGG